MSSSRTRRVYRHLSFPLIRWFLDSSITSVVIILMTLGLCVPMVLTSYVVFMTESRALQGAFHEEQQRSVGIIAKSVSSLLWNLQHDLAVDSLQPYLADLSVCRIRVSDQLSGKLFVALDEPAHCSQTLYTREAPILNGGRQIGVVQLVMSDQPVQEHIRHRLGELALTFGLLIGVVLAVVIPTLVFKVIRPLRKLELQMRKMSGGDLDTVFPWQQDDEIGTVGNAMDQARRQLKHFFEQQMQYNRALAVQAVTDPLTGLANRGLLDEKLLQSVNRHQCYGEAFGVVLMDIDHFKQVNDEFGHLVGDTVLTDMAELLRRHVREADIVGRWGGEEFLIICPGSSGSGLMSLASVLRRVIADHRFPHVGCCTASFGTASYLAGEDAMSLVGRADRALYRAKSAGRNRVNAA